MPLVNKTFDQLLNFTRTTSGTFVGSNGLIQTTPASVNLLTYTQEFDNAAWAKTNTTVTANSTAAPDGTSTADTLTATAGTGVGVRVSQSGTTINATVYTVSFYVRPGTHTFVQLHINAQTADWCNFTLTGSGSVQNNGAAIGAISFDSATGYYRVSMTYTAGGTDRTPFFGLVPSGTATRNQTWNPVGTETVFIWGAQLEAASAATTYTRNNGGVFPPRFEYDPVTLAPKGLLVEEQRTNLLLYSEQLDNAAWAKSNVTLTANAAVSPDGSTTADLIVDPATAAQHLISQVFNVVSGTAYTASFYAKNNGHGQCVYTWSTGNSAFASSNVTFNLLTGVATVVGTGSATMTAVGNGWYRCTATNTATATVIGTAYYLSLNGLSSYTGSGTGGAYFWGAQLEAGAFATSYIPTVASQVTRTADQTSIVAPNFAPWYNQSEGTFVVSYDVLTTATGPKPTAVVFDGTTSNRIYGYVNAALPTVLVTTDGVVQTTISASSVSAGAVNQVAFAYRTDDVAISSNGGAVVTDTSAAVPTVNQLGIGVFTPTVGYLNGHIRSIRYYPTRLTNAQLQALTA